MVNLNRCYVAGLEVSGVFAWTVFPHDLDDVIVFVGSFVLGIEFESLLRGWVGGVRGFPLDCVPTRLGRCHCVGWLVCSGQ